MICIDIEKAVWFITGMVIMFLIILFLGIYDKEKELK